MLYSRPTEKNRKNMNKELRKKISVDVVNNNIKEIIAMEKNGNSIGAYCLIINKTIDHLKKKNL
tara:strand:- start:4 stop:195 length:192 start_codon:yes stop_codon:yes gene_type:complete